MKRIYVILSCLLWPLLGQAKLNVVVTTPDLGSVAGEIGGDRIELTVLMKPTEDPHFVDPKPSFITKLARADVLVEGGAELETGWLSALLQRASNPRIAPGKAGRILANQGNALGHLGVFSDARERLERARTLFLEAGDTDAVQGVDEVLASLSEAEAAAGRGEA